MRDFSNQRVCHKIVCFMRITFDKEHGRLTTILFGRTSLATTLVDPII